MTTVRIIIQVIPRVHAVVLFFSTKQAKRDNELDIPMENLCRAPEGCRVLLKSLFVHGYDASI